MTPQDLATLHAAAFRFPRPWTAAEFASLLAAPTVFLVSTPGGFALGRTAGPEAELLSIAVAPAQRRQGLGARLMRDFAAAASARAAHEAFLEVAARNAPALSLYQRCGWRQTGRRPGYYIDAPGGPQDALILALDLSLASAPAQSFTASPDDFA